MNNCFYLKKDLSDMVFICINSPVGLPGFKSWLKHLMTDIGKVT